MPANSGPRSPGCPRDDPGAPSLGQARCERAQIDCCHHALLSNEVAAQRRKCSSQPKIAFAISRGASSGA
jgi:hypothetical protein